LEDFGVSNKSGQDFLDLAATKIGQKYVYGADVPLDGSDWNGPWDCAEFVTWVVRQVTGKLYGCLDPDSDDPDAWTGAWARDVRKGIVIGIPVGKATVTPGAILLRYGIPDCSRHIVFSDGCGGTIEAKGALYGVCRSKVEGRVWSHGILIPEVNYETGRRTGSV
jgi:hypothetical protein